MRYNGEKVEYILYSVFLMIMGIPSQIATPLQLWCLIDAISLVINLQCLELN